MLPMLFLHLVQITLKRIIRIVIWIAAIAVIIYMEFKTTTTGNKKADKALQEQSKERPETGDLEFKK